MGADYSFDLISIETYAPQFIRHNKLFLGSVYYRNLLLDFFASHLVSFIYLGFCLASKSDYEKNIEVFSGA